MESRASCALLLAAVLVGACSNPASPSATGGSTTTGQWNGTTRLGTPISFTVSADEKVTSITIGYEFNGCSGTQSFGNLSLDTAPNVICVPGPCSASVSSYRAFYFFDGAAALGQATVVQGLFLPDRAEGQVGFMNFPNCGTLSGVSWSATRR